MKSWQKFLKKVALRSRLAMWVFLKVKVQGGDVKYSKEILVPCKDDFTGMQRATAFPISSVAALMAEGKFDDRVIQNRGGDVKLPLTLAIKMFLLRILNLTLTSLSWFYPRE